MQFYDAKFQEHCFNISRDRLFSIFHFFVANRMTSSLHNRKMSISLKRKKIFQKEKRHSSVFWKAFQISTKNFSFHRHFKGNFYSLTFAKKVKVINNNRFVVFHKITHYAHWHITHLWHGGEKTWNPRTTSGTLKLTRRPRDWKMQPASSSSSCGRRILLTLFTNFNY